MCGRDIQSSITREMSGDLESGMLAVGKNDFTIQVCFKSQHVKDEDVQVYLHELNTIEHLLKYLFCVTLENFHFLQELHLLLHLPYCCGRGPVETNHMPYLCFVCFFANISKGYGTVTY